jgi:pimeloyl-ACP methyl ester carboxylesterase
VRTFVTSPIRLVSPILRLFAQPLLFRSFPAAQRTKALLGRYSDPDLQQLFADVHARVPPHVIAARVRMVLRVDVRRQLQSCRTPTIYIAAKRDRVVPRRNLRLIQRIHPNLKTVTIKGPHGITQAQPIEAAEAISNFAKYLTDQSHTTSSFGSFDADVLASRESRKKRGRGPLFSGPIFYYSHSILRRICGIVTQYQI